MTLTQLQAFVKAAALQTFTAAAAELKMSQPAVSDLIRRLEQELGASLFHRGPRALVLTAAGEQLLPHAAQAVASANEGMMAVHSQLGLVGGTATFGLLRNADHYFKSDLVVRFRSEYENVRIRLTGQNSAETAQDISEGVLEAGLVALPIDDDGLHVVPLARDEILYVSSDPKRAAAPVSVRDFCAAELVLYDAHFAATDPARRQLHERAQLAGYKLEPNIEVEYLPTALSLVTAGYGDTIISRAASRTFLGGNLFVAPFEEPLFETLALVKRRGAPLSPATREMARMAASALFQYQRSEEGTAEVIVDNEQLDLFFGLRMPR